MKVIIAGGRDYLLTEWDYATLDLLHLVHDFQEVVTGGARGADTCGERWAMRNAIPVRRFPADWNGPHKKRAGFVRNQAMADYADALIAFPGGNGTADMLRRAKAGGLEILLGGL